MIFSIHKPRNKYYTMPVQLHLVGIDHLQEPVQRPNGTPIFQWFYCAEGSGEIMIDHRTSILHKGQGLLIYPHIPHAYHALTSDWTMHIFGFQGPVCAELLKTLGMCESGVYHLSDPDIFEEHIQKLHMIYETKSKNKQLELSKECYAFLLDLSCCINQINTAIPAQGNEIVRQIVSYLEENYAHTFSLDDLAEQIQLTKEYMCTLFKQSMQQTIVHYLMGIRINHARILLGQYPNLKVMEVARMCGFESPSYFGKIFKQIMGMTPETYRKERYG